MVLNLIIIYSHKLIIHCDNINLLRLGLDIYFLTLLAVITMYYKTYDHRAVMI